MSKPDTRSQARSHQPPAAPARPRKPCLEALTARRVANTAAEGGVAGAGDSTARDRGPEGQGQAQNFNPDFNL